MSTIVTRSGKGSPLSHVEVDANFTNLNTDKIQSGNTVAALTITSATINGGSINGTTVGDTTRSTGAFTTLASNGATTFTAGTASTSTTTGTAVITGGLGVSGRINATNFDGIVGANTAAAGSFTTLGATGVATFSAGTVSLPAITTTGDTNTGIFFPAADTIAFSKGGTEAMRIDSNGNVGIGVVPSAWASGDTVEQIKAGSSYGSLWGRNGTLRTIVNSYFDGTNYKYSSSSYAPAIYQIGDGSNAAPFQWSVSPVGTAGANATFTTAMSLDINGNLLVGTTSTNGISGSILGVGGTGTRYIDVTGGGSGANGGLIMGGNSSYNQANLIWVTSSNYVQLAANPASSQVRCIAGGSGGVYLAATATAWASLSDETTKTNLKPIENAVDKVSTLRSVTGRYKTDDEATSRSFLIAQDVQKVLPEAVNIQDKETGVLGLQYTDVIPLLVASIKELNADLVSTKLMLTEVSNKVNAQAAEIAELKAKP
jgi:hypothetical protein